MSDLVITAGAAAGAREAMSPSHAGRQFVIVLLAFLTVVDLFATQAILPSLAHHYAVTPAAMGLAVNASTLGMAIAGLLVALFSARLDRRRGVTLSLLVLSVPTSLLAFAPGLLPFALLRVLQGLCMATAFSLTLAHLGETSRPRDTAAAFAAYITGNVASNLVGRLMSAALAEHWGLATNFLVFALCNLLGAALAYSWMASQPDRPAGAAPKVSLAMVAAPLRQPRLLAAFAIGFCILFAFIGTFTFVNFILVRPPLLLNSMQVGLVYAVFVPSIVTTPLAGQVVFRFGLQPAFRVGIALALAGLPLLVWPALPAVLLGLVLVGIGTFFAQAVATGFVGRAAGEHRGPASGLYLASYFSGGLAGTAVLGLAFDSSGWPLCVAGVGVALLVAFVLGRFLVLPSASSQPA
jgi:predicted MFS family arabinose efflux permease